MATHIRSLLVSGPVMVPLSSGTTVRLSPGQVSAELTDVEVTNNPKVDKLRELGVIEVETVAEVAKEDKDEKERPRKSQARSE